MRCISCNEALSDYEASRRSVRTHQYIDLCNDCFRYVRDDIAAVGNVRLINEGDDDIVSKRNITDDYLTTLVFSDTLNLYRLCRLLRLCTKYILCIIFNIYLVLRLFSLCTVGLNERIVRNVP